MKASVQRSIEKLALMGEMVGFEIEFMIELLESGMNVTDLLDLIAWRMQNEHRSLNLTLPGRAA